MRCKIIGFTKYPNGEDKDCLAITDGGESIEIDPFVGCSWDYNNRLHLLNEWVEDPKAWRHTDGVWLTGDEFRVIPAGLLQKEAA